jgi:hypothetical protein
MHRWNRSLLSVILALAVSSLASAKPLPPADFNRLYQQLDSNVYRERAAAQTQLERQARIPGGLTAQQVGILQRAATDPTFAPSLEVQRRAQRIFAVFSESFPSVAQIVANLQVQVNVRTGDFTLGAARGRYNPMIAADRNDALILQKNWLALERALSLGNVNDAIAAYDSLNTFVRGLGNAGLLRLNVQINGRNFTLDDWGAVIINTDNAFSNLPNDLRQGGANPAPPPRPPIPVKAPGAVNVGRTVGLTVAGVSAPGSLDLVFEDPLSPPSVLPPELLSTGEVFSVVADSSLRVAGPTHVRIEFDPAAVDPALLTVVRIANGDLSFLTTDFVDAGNGAIEAWYDATAEADQFGELALVQTKPVPAPKAP